MAQYDQELEALVSRLNAATPMGESPSPGREPVELPVRQPVAAAESQGLGPLDDILRPAVERGASDLILTDGCGVVTRYMGELVTEPKPVLTDQDIRRMVTPLLTSDLAAELQRDLSLDFSFVRPGIGRFAFNALVARHIETPDVVLK